MDTQEKNRILIVDDDKLNLMALTNILKADYTIYTAKDGMSAIETARSKKPDLILLDILMPEMDGYEVLSILKKEEETRRIPVIIISGISETGSEAKGLSLNAADYISKPFLPEIVKLRVKNQMEIIDQFRLIEQLSKVDQLTGIPNRRYFDQYLSMMWGMAIREQKPVGLLMIDADKFKNYNDTYGHVQGDTLLKMMADTFSRTLKRSGDSVFRYGGEEFSVILPNTDIDGAVTLAEQIREAVEDLIIPCLDGTPTNITVSIGAHSLIPVKSDTIESLVDKADQALYNAKQTGRNRVCLYVDS